MGEIKCLYFRNVEENQAARGGGGGPVCVCALFMGHIGYISF